MARMLAFMAGLALLFHEAVIEVTPRSPLLIVAVGMLGPVVASTVATLVESLRGVPSQPPPTDPTTRIGEGGGP